jgi:hypothetical protein
MYRPTNSNSTNERVWLIWWKQDSLHWQVQKTDTKHVYILYGELEKAKHITLSVGLNCSLWSSCKMHLTHEIIWRKIIKRNGKFVLKPTFYLKWEKIRIPAVKENSL